MDFKIVDDTMSKEELEALEKRNYSKDLKEATGETENGSEGLLMGMLRRRKMGNRRLTVRGGGRGGGRGWRGRGWRGR